MNETRFSKSLEKYCIELPDQIIPKIDWRDQNLQKEICNLFSNTLIISKERESIWKAGFERFILGVEENSKPTVKQENLVTHHLSSFLELMPQLEFSLRAIFSLINNDEDLLKPAEHDIRYITMSQILKIENNNDLPKEITMGARRLMFDFFEYKNGPCLRNNLSHGVFSFDGSQTKRDDHQPISIEQKMKTIEKINSFSTAIFSVIIFLCVRYHQKGSHFILSEPMKKMCRFVEDYKAIYHPMISCLDTFNHFFENFKNFSFFASNLPQIESMINFSNAKKGKRKKGGDIKKFEPEKFDFLSTITSSISTYFENCLETTGDLKNFHICFDNFRDLPPNSIFFDSILDVKKLYLLKNIQSCLIESGNLMKIVKERYSFLHSKFDGCSPNNKPNKTTQVSCYTLHINLDWFTLWIKFANVILKIW